ncbi:MAG: hypothetical protein ABI577_03350 [bacterium]
MVVSPGEQGTSVGELVASYGWSLRSRGGVLTCAGLAVAVALGWNWWEFVEYGGFSVGGGVVAVVGFVVSVPLTKVGLSDVGDTPLKLFEFGLTSSIHPTPSRCQYSEIEDIRIVKGRSSDYVALMLRGGGIIRIERITRRKDAIAEIHRRVRAVGKRPTQTS